MERNTNTQKLLPGTVVGLALFVLCGTFPVQAWLVTAQHHLKAALYQGIAGMFIVAELALGATMVVWVSARMAAILWPK